MKEKKNWFMRHKIITGIILFFLLIMIIGMCVPSETDTKTEDVTVTEEEQKWLDKVEEEANKEVDAILAEEQKVIDDTPKYKEEWHKEFEFTGSGTKTTDTFFIVGDKFRITYDIKGDPEYTLLTITTYEQRVNSFIAIDIIMVETGTDTSVIHKGQGTYYLDIGAANVDKWTIIVEDYY